MKPIAYITLTATLWMASTWTVTAQDPRQRTTATIVQDALAQLPIQHQKDFNREMNDLAQAAPQSITVLAGMLQPAAMHTKNLVEYAISGVVAFASAHEEYRDKVREGLTSALTKAVDQTAKDFLQSQLRLLSVDNDVSYPTHTGTTPYAEVYDRLVTAGDKAEDEIIKAVQSNDHALRMMALGFATDHHLGTPSLGKKLAALYRSGNEESRADILYWLGENYMESQRPLLLKAAKKKGVVGATAIAALGKVGGEESADALIALLGTDQSSEATKALQAYREDLNDKVTAALQKAKGTRRDALLGLAGSRRIKSTATQVLQWAEEGDVSAKRALEGVVSEIHVSRLSALLDKAADTDIEPFQKALSAAVAAADPIRQYTVIKGEMERATNRNRFYNPLIATGAVESIKDLSEAYQQTQDAEALKALKKSTNHKAAPSLFLAAKSGDEEALDKYVALVIENERNMANRLTRLQEAMKLARSTNVKRHIIGGLGTIPTRNAFIACGNYLSQRDLSYATAQAVKSIINRTDEEIEYNIVQENLNRCIDIFKSNGTADDGYAVDELKKILAEQQPSPIFILPKAEEEAGYEILFDGTNLDKWTGNKEGYLPINGCIYVTANYGNESNLYTIQEYEDFVFRFEFCFTQPGVNNGVGIRTPKGVDAAYDAMCECQILDHDDPIYAGLQAYQVHGSVYGVIPAKRIKHKPLGEWSTEEIRVQGNHITVTVNGEVILDGDVKEACQGHNVAPDGSNKNPYTADHKNHPGLFNKKGFISFCGHGQGVKFRNIRVLDLSAKKKRK